MNKEKGLGSKQDATAKTEVRESVPIRLSVSISQDLPPQHDQTAKG